MSQLQGKRILIIQQRGWGVRTGHFLAKKLQAEGCSLAAFVLKKGALRFINEQKEVHYDLIVDGNELTENPDGILAGANYSLEEICDNLEIDSVWPLVQSLRSHIKSYKDKYAYGFKQNISDEEIVKFVKANYKIIKNIFDDFKPQLIITPNFVTLRHIMMNIYAQKHGVKMIRLTDARIRDLSVIVYDYHEHQSPFFDRLKALNNGVRSENIDKAKNYIKASQNKLIMPSQAEKIFFGEGKSLWKKIKKEILPYYQIFKYRRARREEKSKKIKVSLDSLSPRYILRDHYARKRCIKFVKKYNFVNLDDCGKYVYFPLQFQPEETIDVLAPRFNNQIETIRQVAMSMPGDYTVVVKDHPTAIEYRAPSYLEKIARIPNVKLIDPRIPPERVLRGSAMVFSLSGTTITEAAFLKKPTIQFGELGLTKPLPNVFKHSDFLTLSKKIKELLTLDLDTKEYDRQLLNYVAAMYDVSTDVDYAGIWEGRNQDRMDELWQFYKKEICHLLSENK